MPRRPAHSITKTRARRRRHYRQNPWQSPTGPNTRSAKQSPQGPASRTHLRQAPPGWPTCHHRAIRLCRRCGFRPGASRSRYPRSSPTSKPTAKAIPSRKISSPILIHPNELSCGQVLSQLKHGAPEAMFRTSDFLPPCKWAPAQVP